MRFQFSFYELMPDYQSIRNKLKDREKQHF